MSRPKVYVSRPDIGQAALEMLGNKCDLIIWPNESPAPRSFLLEKVKGVDGICCMITDNIDAELLEAAGPNLKVIGTMSVGYDHVDIEAMKSAGVKLGNTPGVLTDATAELTVALLLATSRRLFEGREELLNGGWAKSAWGPGFLCGQGLAGSTVGIYGLGRIGQAVMERLVPFRPAKFLYSGRSKKDNVSAEFVDLATLLRESDFVIVTCALNAETKEMFNANAFNLMKPTAIFVNSSRGGVVQQDDLIAALKSNTILAAGLDVMTPEPLPTDHELTKLKNCVIIPHMGSATVQSRTLMATMTVRNILAGLEGTPLPSQVGLMVVAIAIASTNKEEPQRRLLSGKRENVTKSSAESLPESTYLGDTADLDR
ncbi:unnamed protein product, partial [Allacma fusca]